MQHTLGVTFTGLSLIGPIDVFAHVKNVPDPQGEARLSSFVRSPF
jgi:hypothetical protein